MEKSMLGNGLAPWPLLTGPGGSAQLPLPVSHDRGLSRRSPSRPVEMVLTEFHLKGSEQPPPRRRHRGAA